MDDFKSIQAKNIGEWKQKHNNELRELNGTPEFEPLSSCGFIGGKRNQDGR